MKVLVVVALILGVAFAAPNKQLQFRNLYKQPAPGAPKSHHPSGRIINGEIAEPHSIPYQAFLEVFDNSGSGWYCGGSLISETVILTAGHCGYGARQAQITLGAQKPLTKEDSQVVVISNDIIVHKEYDGELIINDIGLMRLSKPVPLSDAVALAKLPTAADANKTYAGETGRVSGWGLTDGFGNSISDVLRYTENPILTNDECGQFFGEVPSTQVCLSGKDGHRSCNGDSGGPLVVDGVQIGVVSYGVKYCLEGYPSAYTRITSYLDWIANNSKA